MKIKTGVLITNLKQGVLAITLCDLIRITSIKNELSKFTDRAYRYKNLLGQLKSTVIVKQESIQVTPDRNIHPPHFESQSAKVVFRFSSLNVFIHVTTKDNGFTSEHVVLNY